MIVLTIGEKDPIISTLSSIIANVFNIFQNCWKKWFLCLHGFIKQLRYVIFTYQFT